VRLSKYAGHGHVLDAGCGDGKNALYLEQRGYKVYGVDSSRAAIDGLRNRFAGAHWNMTGRYEVLDVQQLTIEGYFDILVSYGLFHCLAVEARLELHRRLQAKVRPGGIMVFCSLTSHLSMPPDHGTDDILLPDDTEVAHILHGWQIEHFEDGIFEEEHQPVIGLHKHSAVWVIARRT